MRHKANLALGVKSTARGLGDKNSISNMEGMLHSFVIPLLLGYMHGDYCYDHGHQIKAFAANGAEQSAREVIISALIHPDFETHEVMLRFCSVDSMSDFMVTDSVTTSTSLNIPGKSSAKRDMHSANPTLQDWDRRIKYQTLMYLYQVDSLADWYKAANYMQRLTSSSIEVLLSPAIQDQSQEPREAVRYRTFELQSSTSTPTIISLEALFLVVFQQVRNELLALERICGTTGYIYTYDPPVIFRQALAEAGQNLMMLVHAAALRQFSLEQELKAMKFFAYNDFDNPNALSTIRAALRNQNVQVMRKAELFNGHDPMYSPPPGAEDAMLVLHNNSDAFGQNIEFEDGHGSMDAVIGQYSSAAASLLRTRPDLVSEEKIMRW